MPSSPPAPVVSVRPVVLPAPERGDDLQVRVSAPVSGDRLPVVVLSHGSGSSMDGYDPLVHAWTAAGLAVVQPTHLDSWQVALAPDDPRGPDVWRTRVDDLVRAIDGLEAIEAAVPGLAGRLDASRVAVAGHSWGAQTAGTLLGATVLDADGRPGQDLTDPRVVGGVLLSAPGRGGAGLSPSAAQDLPFMNPGFDAMAAPALVVAGDHDDSPLSTRGPDWSTDAYTGSPGRKDLLTVLGGEHYLGGISGHAVTETTDEDPERVALVRRVTTAWLLTTLGVDDGAWPAARAALLDGAERGGRLDPR